MTRVTAVGIALCCVSLASADEISFMGLGDLPGGPLQSEARGVSADGSVVAGVGYVDGLDAMKALRWTEAGA